MKLKKGDWILTINDKNFQYVEKVIKIEDKEIVTQPLLQREIPQQDWAQMIDYREDKGTINNNQQTIHYQEYCATFKYKKISKQEYIARLI